MLLLVGLAGFTDPWPDPADAFNRVATHPPLLRAFLHRMPKGADLHTHLSGATYAEELIKAGAEENLCVTIATTRISQPPCGQDARALTDVARDLGLTTWLVSAWSMHAFVPSSGHDGHSHFFGAFERFSGAAPQHVMARAVVNRAAAQNMRHIELMLTIQGRAVTTLADRIHGQTPWTEASWTAFEAALLAGGLPDLVWQGAKDAAAMIEALRRSQRCDLPDTDPEREIGCGMSVRWLLQVTRTNPPWQVHAQTLFAAMLQDASRHIAGLNFVGPEDHPIALTSYSLHMRLIRHVRERHPETRVALHAGELRLGLVPPHELTFHIREAVEIAGARRIGHGVSIMHESDPFTLLRRMAERRVAVEINLTSNDQILGVRGAEHPLPIYLARGVPVVISTDDEGISRIDRTHELQRAITTYGLTWPDLVALERNSLEHAFLRGASLWSDPVRWRKVPACAEASLDAPPPATCSAFLQGSEKARLQWDLERALAAFGREASAMALP
jgi:adenosine deaminase